MGIKATTTVGNAGEPRGNGTLYFMCYNFARVDQTLRVTAAMEAGIADHI
jgi:hypothetical protein